MAGSEHEVGMKRLIVRGSVVGIVDSPAALRAARSLTRGDVDFLEWRVDCMGADIPDVPDIAGLRIPWIVTARHPAEGGQNAMSGTARREALLRLLPQAAIVDIEVRSLAGMNRVVQCAKTTGRTVLASFHDFRATPSASRLKEVIRRAQDGGADAVKIATVTSKPGDVARLLDLFATSKLPLAVMGMGPLGTASRVLLATCGSVLNYGWLHRPNVAGQCSAIELRDLLTACGARSGRSALTKSRADRK